MAEGRNVVLKFINVFRGNGGIYNTFKKQLRGIDFKVGTLVGTDEFGNKYYENNSYFVGRNRWVEYNEQPLNSAYSYWVYDATQIPPRWHRWMHQFTDDPPSTVPIKPEKFELPHEPSHTSTNKSYTPFNTVPPKIHSWKPE